MAERVDLDAVVARHVAGSFEESQADVPALVAECKASRNALDQVRLARAAVRQLLDDDGFSGTLPASVRRTLRQVHTDLDVAVAITIDQATGRPDPAAGHASPEGPP